MVPVNDPVGKLRVKNVRLWLGEMEPVRERKNSGVGQGRQIVDENGNGLHQNAREALFAKVQNGIHRFLRQLCTGGGKLRRVEEELGENQRNVFGKAERFFQKKRADVAVVLVFRFQTVEREAGITGF